MLENTYYPYMPVLGTDMEIRLQLPPQILNQKGREIGCESDTVIATDETYGRKEVISVNPRIYDYLLANVREPQILRELREETATMRGSQMQVSPDETQLLAMLVQILAAERCIEVGVYTVCMCGIILSFSLITDGRRRHKKPHSGTEKKSSSAPRQPRTGIIWTETDEYFRELTIEDIERLEEVSAGFSGNEKCFMIPCLDNDDSVCRQYDALNGLLMQFRENDDLNIANVNELDRNGMVNEILVKEENEQDFMDVDGNGNLSIQKENNGVKRENGEKELSPFRGVEWLLGSRNKTYVVSERPSKKRKLLGRDSGLILILLFPASVVFYVTSITL
ncbi:S-adenosyl-L-methionine-dependent methyltransferase superfamily protein isoform 1 [Dorcoceras hygrometricum]|uniref:S-adenosyl-L-methionine-dependent methyltransferase superfamily protein isoform 1 n=1 Tax=Dorcoceras hygrometricum TaxID=472368 RepID=A0A2Z7APP0_9LAMI|nr:S-adenosyl-L-methionine-dependent methyltransferase superfamily protein isoform 1 [Dorcoceras hygrometricum]